MKNLRQVADAVGDWVFVVLEVIAAGIARLYVQSIILQMYGEESLFTYLRKEMFDKYFGGSKIAVLNLYDTTHAWAVANMPQIKLAAIVAVVTLVVSAVLF